MILFFINKLALGYACESGHTEVAEILLKSGAHTDDAENEGRTPLMKAARAGHTCTVRYLISKGADVNRSTSTNDATVLSLACAGGHFELATILLLNGADPNHLLKVRLLTNKQKYKFDFYNESLGSIKLFN